MRVEWLLGGCTGKGHVQDEGRAVRGMREGDVWVEHAAASVLLGGGTQVGLPEDVRLRAGHHVQRCMGANDKTSSFQCKSKVQLAQALLLRRPCEA